MELLPKATEIIKLHVNGWYSTRIVIPVSPHTSGPHQVALPAVSWLIRFLPVDLLLFTFTATLPQDQ